MNIYATWLYLIGNSTNAKRLRLRLEGLKPPPLDALFGPEPKQCPLTVIYGAEVSRKAYADPMLRPALDSWDSGYLEITDLRRLCLEIETGRYQGPSFVSSYGDGLLLAYPASRVTATMILLQRQNPSQLI